MPLPPNFLPSTRSTTATLGGRDERLFATPRTPRKFAGNWPPYYAVISHMDAQIGRILHALDATGQAGNTIVIFSSDQGLAIGSHGLRGRTCTSTRSRCR